MLELDQASAIILTRLMSKRSGGDVDVKRLDVTENGTYKEDGKAYSPVVVNVPNPSTGSINITTNETHDVTDYASAVVAVPQGEPIEVSTSEGMAAALTAENVGKVFKFTGETTADYIHGDLYIVEEAE